MTRYGGKSPHRSMVHMNGNLLCAVDVETTGLVVGEHDIVQIAIVPLDGEIEPIKTVTPFYTNMRPKRPENIQARASKINRLKLTEICRTGLDPWTAVDLFEEWFNKLELPINKKIVPLAHNWPFDRAFIMEWLGDANFNHFFSPQYRDTMVAASYLNDRADHHAERPPFPKVNLQYCCTTLGIKNDMAHNALCDCLATAKIYKGMLLKRVM